jgi:putative FmdB family regulatory protein
MPTYDYKCSNCQHTFEYFQTMSAELLTKCPECGGVLKRIIGTGAGPIFKGSGFYQTDYKSKPSESKNSSKTESKPPVSEKETKKETKKE